MATVQHIIKIKRRLKTFFKTLTATRIPSTATTWSLMSSTSAPWATFCETLMTYACPFGTTAGASCGRGSAQRARTLPQQADSTLCALQSQTSSIAYSMSSVMSSPHHSASRPGLQPPHLSATGFHAGSRATVPILRPSPSWSSSLRSQTERGASTEHITQ